MRNSILSTGNTGYTGGSTNSKKIILIIIIVLIALIIVGGGVLAYTYLFTDTFLSEQQGFYKYIAKNSEIAEMLIDEDLEKYMEKTEKEAYSNNGEISVAVSGDLDEETKTIVDEIQKHKITYNGSVDTVNKYAHQELKFKYGESDIISGILLNKNDYYGLKVNDIGLNPYIVFENNNLKQFAKNLGATDEIIKVIPDKIEYAKIKDIFTKDELKQIKAKYLKVVVDNIPEDRFSKSEKDGMEIYTLTINEDTAKAVALPLMDTLVNDELLLNKIKKVCVEIIGLSEQEAETIISSFKQSIEDAKKELTTPQSIENNNYSATSGITSNVETAPAPNQEDENLYINVYVSSKDLVKTEIIFGEDSKTSIINEKNKVTVELAENNSWNTEDGNPTVFETAATFIIEKNKTNSELTYKITTLGEENKKYVTATLTYTGLSEMANVSTNLLYDINVSDILNNSIYNTAQDAANNSISAIEKEEVQIALIELQTSIYKDSYISGEEVVVNETTLKQVLAKQNLDISLNEDGTYRLKSNTTQNIYTVDSTGKLINTEEGIVIQEEITDEEAMNEEKTMILSLNLKDTTTFGAVQQQELTESNMYIINNKTYEQLESLFTTLGQRVENKVMNFYKNTTIGQLMIQN